MTTPYERTPQEEDRAFRQAEIEGKRSFEHQAAEHEASELHREILRGNSPTHAYPDWSATWPQDKPSYTSPTGRDTPKWRGISLTKLRDAEREIGQEASLVANLKKALARAEATEAEAVEAYRVEVSALMRQEVTIGRYECSESPTETHLLSADDDNTCIICGFYDYPDK